MCHVAAAPKTYDHRFLHGAFLDQVLAMAARSNIKRLTVT